MQAAGTDCGAPQQEQLMYRQLLCVGVAAVCCCPRFIAPLAYDCSNCCSWSPIVVVCTHMHSEAEVLSCCLRSLLVASCDDPAAQ